MRRVDNVSIGSGSVAIIHNNDFPAPDSDPDGSFLCIESKSSIVEVAGSVKRALMAQGFETVDIWPISNLHQVEELLQAEKYDLIFNICESLNDDAQMEIEIVKLLERYNVPFSGNNSQALKLALDKFGCNNILQQAGVIVPESHCITTISEVANLQLNNNVYIIKPNDQDGSTGIEFCSVAHTREDLYLQVDKLLTTHNTRALIQEYIEGGEINLSFVNLAKKRFWNCTEIDFSNLDSRLPHILNYSSKWHPDTPEYGNTFSVKAKLSKTLKKRIYASIEKTIDALQLDSYARIDFRVTPAEIPYVVDVNPNCDLGETSGFALAAQYNDVSYQQIIYEIVENAMEIFVKRNPHINMKTLREKIYHGN